MSAAVWVRAWVRPLPAATRVRARVRAPLSCAASKAARCPFTAVCLSAASPTSSASSTRSSASIAVAEIAAAEKVSEFTLDKIIALGLLRKKNGLIKVLNNGEIKVAVTVHAHKFSKTAQEAIEKAGGKAILIG